MINIALKGKQHRYPKDVPNRKPAIKITNAQLLGVKNFKLIGNVTIFKKGKLFFMLSASIGQRFSTKYPADWKDVAKSTRINFEYADD